MENKSSPRIDIRDLLELSAVPGIGSRRIRHLINYFGSSSEPLRCSPQELTRVEMMDKKTALAVARREELRPLVDKQLSLLNKINGKIITFWDETYPEYLQKIYDPPPFIFVLGELVAHDKYAIAIVGTRRPTTYGKLMAEKFAREIAEKGITIVSGLARGIDTVAHQSALRANGRTIAIIGSAIDVIYPPENKSLAERIAESGAVVSEFLMGTKPDPGNFPRRNRIISGISLGTLVVETQENGGAMITASTALDQNREIFCIPGNITERQSIGTNRLIRDGRAKLVTCIDDIIDELSLSLRPILKPSEVKPLPQLSIFEQTIVEHITYEPIHIDLISDRSGFSAAETQVHLLSLEFKNVIRQLPGKYFLRF